MLTCIVLTQFITDSQKLNKKIALSFTPDNLQLYPSHCFLEPHFCSKLYNLCLLIACGITDSRFFRSKIFQQVVLILHNSSILSPAGTYKEWSALWHRKMPFPLHWHRFPMKTQQNNQFKLVLFQPRYKQIYLFIRTFILF